ncbi:hypothetical protein QQO16_01825 [Limosilactobacillus reuteri]|uniref:hypothetical protein n=1 Tax=Limosilactobacillus reuteri TaxID=1598 RepID=UPI00255204F2|nr:hypothetical protein [Limosilactobacillus reuteri]MDL2056791.1 hypothetical protein [Limosilactobacillus reuteri]
MNHINYISAIITFIPMIYTAGYWIWIFNNLTDVEASLLKLKTHYNIFLLWLFLSVAAIIVLISMIVEIFVLLNNNQLEETKGLCAFCICYVLSILTGFYLYKHEKSSVFLFYKTNKYQYLHRLDDEYITMKLEKKQYADRVYILSLKSLNGKYLFTKDKNNFSIKQKMIICILFGIIAALYSMACLWMFHIITNKWCVSILSLIIGGVVAGLLYFAATKVKLSKP